MYVGQQDTDCVLYLWKEVAQLRDYIQTLQAGTDCRVSAALKCAEWQANLLIQPISEPDQKCSGINNGK